MIITYISCHYQSLSFCFKRVVCLPSSPTTVSRLGSHQMHSTTAYMLAGHPTTSYRPYIPPPYHDWWLVIHKPWSMRCIGSSCVCVCALVNLNFLLLFFFVLKSVGNSLRRCVNDNGKERRRQRIRIMSHVHALRRRKWWPITPARIWHTYSY